MKTLNEILEFSHTGVINRYVRDHHVTHEVAEQLFSDLMRFFWLSKKHQLDKKENPSKINFQFTFIMDEEMKEIDSIWHIFLLYTEDYQDFCFKYFGEFLHHKPDIVPGMEQSVEKFQLNLERFLDYTIDYLGEEVVERWFATTSNDEVLA